MLKENVVLFLDALSMTDENYDILDDFESSGRIDKLTSKTVNTFVFYYAKGQLRVASSNLSMETYRKRLRDKSPYVWL